MLEKAVSINLSEVSKKFGREWIFRKLERNIHPVDKLVILGGNGSGKSTLLQLISGYLIPDEGKVVYSKNQQELIPEKIHEQVSLASPYLQLNEDFTLHEILQHTALFKPFIPTIKPTDAVQILELDTAKNKLIKHFSSGMKQRLKLGLAILADAPVLLLDEPVSNLDAKAINWYQQMIKTYAAQKTIIVCSNEIKSEYSFCTETLNIQDYK